MNTIEVKIEQYEGEIREIKDEINNIDNATGKYAGLSNERKIDLIEKKEQSILSKETLMNTLLQKKSGKGNCNIISSY